MSYIPKVNDYIIWKNNIRGWIYFKTKEYLTIEMNVKPKNDENYQASSIHANDRLLVLCYHNQWKELTYIRSRESIYEKEKDVMEIMGESTGSESDEK